MFSDVSDLDLASTVAEVIAVPRIPPADSFVLHAPLELLARTALLPMVTPMRRDEARQRIVDLAALYEAFGDGVGPPAVSSFDSVGDAATWLISAIRAGETDDADAAAAWLGGRVRPDDLGPLLGDALAPLLAAAGHAPIFLTNWPRVSPRHELTGTLLRPLVRSLCARPDWRIEWIDSPPSASSDVSVFETLAATPLEGPAENDFIHPTMKRIDHERTAARLAPATFGTGDVWRASTEIVRVAAWTMLHEPGPAAPYLWSHCLTMPQAVLALMPGSSGPRRLLAIAATHVAGFRSAHASTPLPSTPSPPGPSELSLIEAIESSQDAAAAAAWHTPVSARRSLITELVDRAATHEDAHLVKYTLTCLDAAADDPEMAHLYLAAAASLSAWWAGQDRLGR